MKYNIYLLNPEYRKLDDVKIQLIDPDYKKLDNKWATEQFSFRFFLKKNDPKLPGWVNQFENFVELPLDSLHSFSLAAIILVQKNFGDHSRIFAITFAGGWQTIKDEMKEMGFGLRIVLNILVRSGIKGGQARKLAGDTKLKNISLGNPSRFYDLEFNDEIELVRSLHGKSQDLDFASSVKGSDSLAISTKIDFQELEKVLDKAYAYFNSTDYRNDFGFIDKFRPLGRGMRGLMENLNLKVVELLKERDETKISMIAPQSLINKGVKEWSFRLMAADPVTVEELNLFEILDLIQRIDPGFELDLNSMTNKKIIAIIPIIEGRVATEQTKSLFDFLSAEVLKNGQNYVLMDSKWYYVDNDYLKDLNHTLQEVDVVSSPGDLRFPTWAKKGSYFLPEKDYNRQVVRTQRHNMILMDRNLFRVRDENQNVKIEICDILSDHFEFIHVKKCSKSQQFAFLFDQGLVSMDTLFQYYRTETMTFIEEQINANPKAWIKIEKLKSNIHNVQLVYAIASSKSPENFVQRLPFFSKIILTRTVKRVRGYVDKPVKIIVIPMET